MNIPADLKYTKEHEWARIEGELLIVGITDHAQDALGNITFVDLPKVGTTVEAMGETCVVESVKAASDIYSPVGGEVAEVNSSLKNSPELINKDPYGEGWIFKLKGFDATTIDSLLSPEDYEKLWRTHSMAFISNTPEQQNEMLRIIGAKTIDALFADIPEEMRIDSLNIPQGRSELEVLNHIRDLAAKNTTNLTTFLGGGFYDHFIPAAVDALSMRSEFYTAYTPYQPEVSQGTLQAIFEYQTAICRLTDMNVSNASLYDGGTALFEAAMMALRLTRRNKIIVDRGVSPIYRTMLYSYTSNLNIEFKKIPVVHGHSDREMISREIDDKTAGVILQNPNFFGAVDDLSDIIETIHSDGALAIMSVYPISLGILKTPGTMGADIVTGEGQSLGLPLAFGGPYLGFMSTRLEMVRQMPGRIVGRTKDSNGKTGYVLTLQAREQHIRRHKATSNICSNESLCALRAVIYLSLLGKKGLKELALTCARKAEYAKQQLERIPDVEVKRSSPTFNEFVLSLPIRAEECIEKMLEKGFSAGFPLGRYYPDMDNYLLVAVTEKRTKEEIDRFAQAMEDVVCN